MRSSNLVSVILGALASLVPARIQSADFGTEGQYIAVDVLSSRSRLTITVDNREVLDVYTSRSIDDEDRSAGFYMLVLSQHTGRVLMKRRFDTTSYGEAATLYPAIKSTASGRIMILAVKMDAFLNLPRVTQFMLEEEGVHWAPKLTYRGYLGYVGRVGERTLVEAASIDVEAWDIGTYSSPVFVNVQVLKEDPAKCLWMAASSKHRRRRLFCSRYAGYGGLCDCSNPAPIMWNELPCLVTLLQQPGGSVSRTVVSVDGPHKEVMDLLSLLEIRYSINHKYTEKLPLSRDTFTSDDDFRFEAATRISAHYRYSFDLIFGLFPGAPAAIVLEEDLLASPDFFRFFNQTAWLLNADPSIYCVSAWNDLGAMHTSRDTVTLHRIETMPGNGWMLTRDEYDDISRKWHQIEEHSDWDVWLRQDVNEAQRECVVPSVSRVFHYGLSGAHVKGVMTQSHFAGHLATAHYDIDLKGVEMMIQDKYEKEIYRILLDPSTVFLKSKNSPCHKDFLPKDFVSGVVVFFFGMTQRQDTSSWTRVAACLGLFHLDTRGHHRGLFRFHYYKTAVMAIGYPFSDYSFFMPSPVHVQRSSLRPEELSTYTLLVESNRARFRVPDLEQFVPGLLVDRPKKNRMFLAPNADISV